PAGRVGLPGAPLGRLSLPQPEELALALLEIRAAQEVRRHLAARSLAVVALDRREDPLVLLDAERMRTRALTRPDRVHRERAAEGMRQSLDRAVVGGLRDEGMKIPGNLARVRLRSDRRGRLLDMLAHQRNVVLVC